MNLVGKAIFIILIGLTISCNWKKEEINSEFDKASIPVNVYEIKLQEYQINVKGIGRIDSKQKAALIFESQGQLNKIYKRVGEYIEEGDVIAEINSSIYKSNYDLAQAQYKKAKLDLKDAKLLLDENAISDEEYNNINLLEISSKSNFILAKEKYEKCSLTSPFEGAIVDMNLNLGEYISPNTQLSPPVIIADLQNLIIDISISEEDINKIEIDQDVIVSVKSFDEKLYYGKITEVGLMAIQGSNSYNVKVSLNNINNDLKLGMIANVLINIKTVKNVIVIPRKYILEDKSGSYIFINNKGKALIKRIEILESELDNVLIRGDLYEGDLMITTGIHKISQDSEIYVVK